MERLTGKHSYTLSGLNGTQVETSEYVISKLGYTEHDDIHQEIVDKLGKLEDIMEKYGIERVVELEHRLMARDTWEKTAKMIYESMNGSSKPTLEWFYQQAQKEMNNNTKKE